MKKGEKKTSTLLKLNYKQWSKFNFETLKKYALQLGREAIKRRDATLQDIKKFNIPLPTVYHTWYGVTFKGKHASFRTFNFDVNKIKDLPSLRRKFGQIQSFLRSPTSDIEYWKNNLNKFGEGINRLLGYDLIEKAEDLSSRNYKRLWKIYNRLDEEYNFAQHSADYDSHQIQAEIYEIILGRKTKRWTINETIDYMERKINDNYEERRRKEESELAEIQSDLDNPVWITKQKGKE